VGQAGDHGQQEDPAGRDRLPRVGRDEREDHDGHDGDQDQEVGAAAGVAGGGTAGGGVVPGGAPLRPGDGPVLGALVLERAADPGQAADGGDVADEEGQPGDGFGGRVPGAAGAPDEGPGQAGGGEGEQGHEDDHADHGAGHDLGPAGGLAVLGDLARP